MRKINEKKKRFQFARVQNLTQGDTTNKFPSYFQFFL